MQYFKDKNIYLNDSIEKLMIANIMLREYLEEIDANYQELITISKEVLRKKKDTQHQNEELIGTNK